MNLSRLEALVGNDNIEKIKKLNVLVLGLGGVGGYAVEALVRSGIGKITLVDKDVIKPSNANRQIIAYRYNNNRYKTKEWKRRIKCINKDIKVNIINAYINEENINTLFAEKFDYIVDACDTTKTKVALIRECHNRNIKLISSMGTANKLDPSKIIITTLDKTENDPLAKKIRKEFSREKDIMKSVTVVTSNEKPINADILGSSAFVPSTAGLFIASYIINDTVN